MKLADKAMRTELVRDLKRVVSANKVVPIFSYDRSDNRKNMRLLRNAFKRVLWYYGEGKWR